MSSSLSNDDFITALVHPLMFAATGVDDSDPGRFGKVVGTSPVMRKLLALCERLAASDIPVLIEGETGVGKELTAECLHEASARRTGPFVVFDCGSVSASEASSLLFGETGSDGRLIRTGLFEAADGGTLFLDEVGDLPEEAQGAILRTIERGEIRRVGEGRMRRINVRTLAATSRNLRELTEAGRFREDLYFRLAASRVEVPPLRRRTGDVVVLARHFFRALAALEDIPPGFLDRFEHYEWPGNVRELRNAVASTVALGPIAALAPSHGAPARSAVPVADGADVFRQVLAEGLSFPHARQRILEEFERAYITRVLAEHKGNVSRAAAASGIARRYFQALRARARGPSESGP